MELNQSALALFVLWIFANDSPDHFLFTAAAPDHKATILAYRFH